MTQSLPAVVAIVGRPNVGKSTLFNVLTSTRDAIVADVPGVTRDRQYGYGKVGPFHYVVIDTGGVVEKPSGVEAQMREQTERAVKEADRLVFVLDARAGLTREDHYVASELRRAGKQVTLALNKAEGLDPHVIAADFHQLGFGAPMIIAAAHGQGCESLMNTVLEGIAPPDAPQDIEGEIRIAIIGKPNVGKSTLVNRLIGEERVIAADKPGTTRDSIFVPFERDGHRFVLIDTAGVRRRSRIDDAVESQSVSKTLQAIAHAHVVIMVLDAHEAVGEQDASVLGLALERGRALLIAINKWDGIPTEQRDTIRTQLDLKLDFVPYAPHHFISARHGTGVGELAAAAVRAYESAMREMPTKFVNRALEDALQAHQPPIVRGRRIKLRYAHQGGRNPPRIIIHGTQTDSVPEAYRRYLQNIFRKAFDLFATPVSVDFRSEKNPYDQRTHMERHSPIAKQKGSKRGVAAAQKKRSQRTRH